MVPAKGGWDCGGAGGYAGCGSRLWAGNHPLVEAGGQHIHGFRRGLDYAFIRALK
jgi:hypothetical protein